MGNLATALAPAFAAGFAVQRVLEILDSMFGGITKFGNYKKLVFSLVSLIIGLALAFGGHLRIVGSLQTGNTASTTSSSSPSPERKDQSPPIPDWADALITALVISGGTEGFNSIMKFLSYKKEEKKGDAATKIDSSPLSGTPGGEATMARLRR